MLLKQATCSRAAAAIAGMLTQSVGNMQTPALAVQLQALTRKDCAESLLAWRQKSLGLTEEQKRDLMISRTFVLTSLASLLEERGQIAGMLQVLACPRTHQVASLAACTNAWVALASLSQTLALT